MAKPYFLTQRKGVYYVNFYDDESKKVSCRKSTGQTSEKEAHKVAANWLVNGIPSNEKKSNTSVEFQKFSTQVKSADFTDEEVVELLKIMKQRNLIESFVPKNSPSSQKFTDFARDFWTWDKSPYIKEKKLYQHSIHKYYVHRNEGYVDKHLVPFFKDKSIGAVTKQDVKEFMRYLSDLGLSGESINQITRCATTCLKWCYNNGLTENNCYEGLTFVAVHHKQRTVLTMEQASALFAAEWPTEYSRLANLTAMCTGMRAGEIQALRLEDIGYDRIYVRHAWGRGEEGLKTPKNGEEREIPIPPELRDMLLEQAYSNPYDLGLKGYVFWGLLPDKPMDQKPWKTALRRTLKKIGYSNPDEICFHAWRHLYSARMADVIDQRKLQRATGHKTMAMLEHYANHAKEEDLIEVGEKAKELFIDIINNK